MSKRAKFLRWIKIPALVVISYFGICTVAVFFLTISFPKPEYEILCGHESVNFPARNDGLTIAGTYIPNPDSKSAIILVHGRNENHTSAFAGTFPVFACELKNAGFSVLMIDVRGHGKSEFARFDFGVKSKNDVLGAVDWLLAKGFEPRNIGALGISLGGGGVNYAAAEEPAIGVVVGDSTYSDITPVAEQMWTEAFHLPLFLMPGVYTMYQVTMGFDMRDAVPIEAVSEMEPRPVLIVHCKMDKTVPFYQAEEMVEAIPGAESWYVSSGCEHAQIYTTMPDEYASHVISFFEEHLP